MKRNEVKGLAAPGYTIDEEVYQRFDQRHNIFGRMLYDKDAPFYKRDMYENVVKKIREAPGQIWRALERAISRDTSQSPHSGPRART